MARGEQSLFARPASPESSVQALEEEDALLTGRRVNRADRRWQWRQWALFAWASIATVAVIALAAVYQHETQLDRPNPKMGGWGSNGKPTGKRNMIFMVSDGMGPTSLSLTRSFGQYVTGRPFDDVLVLDKHLIGSSRTRSTSSLITDSAAGATVFSCGLKTYNGAISVLPGHTPCGTVLEAAKLAGYMTGLVVTTRITDATPACFAAHANRRSYEDLIATHLLGDYPLGRMVDLIIGGGRCHFLPNTTSGSCRADDRDLVSFAKDNGYAYIDNRKDFDNLKAKGNVQLPLLALVANRDIPYEIDRRHINDEYPSQVEMTEFALSALSAATKDSDKGFFIMIEGSRIDHAGHGNDPAAQVHEVLAHDEAFAAVLDFLDKDDTDGVLVSTSDHETGGLSTGRQLHHHYPKYVWYPGVLANASHSTEYCASKWGQYLRSDEGGNAARADQAAHLKELLESALGIVDYSSDEITAILDAKPDWPPFYLFSDMISRRAQIGWSTHGHTAVDVNIYASDPKHAPQLIGNHENTEVGEFIAQYLDLDLEEVTEQLKAKKVKTSGIHEGAEGAEAEPVYDWMGPVDVPLRDNDELVTLDAYHGDYKHKKREESEEASGGQPPCGRCKRENKECVLGSSHRGGARQRRKITHSQSAPSHYSVGALHQVTPQFHDTATANLQAGIPRSAPAEDRVDDDDGSITDEAIAPSIPQNPSDAWQLLKDVAAREADNLQASEAAHAAGLRVPSADSEGRPRGSVNGGYSGIGTYRLVREGYLTPDIVHMLVHRYFEHYHPYLPLVPRKWYDPARLDAFAVSDKHLLTAVLTIASKDLVDQPHLHASCSRYMHDLISGIAAGHDCDVEAVEALLLLAEWEPQGLRNNIESVGRGEEDRSAWMHVGIALRTGYFLGLDRTAFRQESAIEATVDSRKRFAWANCYVSDRLISVRIGKAFWSRGPGPMTGLSAQDFPSLAPQSPSDEDYGKIFQATLDLTQLYTNVHDVLYSGMRTSGQMMLMGDYIKYVDDFRAGIARWNRSWGGLVCSSHIKVALQLSYQYLCLYTNAFVFQAAISQAIAMKPKGDTHSLREHLRQSFSNIGSMPDARFIWASVSGAKAYLTLLSTQVDPIKHLRYMPLRYYLYAIYSAVFLYKARSFGVMDQPEERQVRQTIFQVAEIMKNASVSSQDPGSRYARLLELLWLKPSKHHTQQAQQNVSSPAAVSDTQLSASGSLSLDAQGYMQFSPANDFSWLDLEAVGDFVSGDVNQVAAHKQHGLSSNALLPMDGFDQQQAANAAGIDSLVEALKSLDRPSQRISVHQIDTGVEEDITRLFAEIKEQHGQDGPSILVSNAGYGKRISQIVDIPIPEFDHTILINLRASFILAKLSVPYMQSHNWGRIIFMGSIAAQGGGINGCHYAASKAGLTGMAKNLAQKLAQWGITVNDVAPAMIGDTGMIPDPKVVEGTAGDVKNIPVGRLGAPQESRLSSGAKALCKHFERGGASSEHGVAHPFWTLPTGSNDNKTAIASAILDQMLLPNSDGAVWRNVMMLHSCVAVYEIRNRLGYGMRWTLQLGRIQQGSEQTDGPALTKTNGHDQEDWFIKSVAFRGFVEPIEGIDIGVGDSEESHPDREGTVVDQTKREHGLFLDD
ncbi:hypothetical protein DV737_g4482, partial [Chaetothyriales sp. CBS 132003]